LHEDVGHRLDEAAAAPGISGAGGPWLGDYTGLPINEAARYKAESWDPPIDSAKEHQTVLQPGAYWIFSPGPLRISNLVAAKGVCPALPARQQSRAAGVRGQGRPATRRRARRSGDGLSGISAEAAALIPDL